MTHGKLGLPIKTPYVSVTVCVSVTEHFQWKTKTPSLINLHFSIYVHFLGVSVFKTEHFSIFNAKNGRNEVFAFFGCLCFENGTFLYI